MSNAWKPLSFLSIDEIPKVAIILFIIGCSWIALTFWSHPQAAWDFNGLQGVSLGNSAPSFLRFEISWVLMTMGMMLPTSLPLVAMFARMTTHHPEYHYGVVALLAGYVGIWSLWGLIVFWIVGRIPLFVQALGVEKMPVWLWAACTCLIAGGYQLSSWKFICLDQCRSPLMFLMQHWRGREPMLEATSLGIRHGLWCIGCCWLLMIVLVVIGTGQLWWMLIFGFIMGLEKNASWGRKLARPIGMCLLLGGIGIGVNGLCAAM